MMKLMHIGCMVISMYHIIQGNHGAAVSFLLMALIYQNEVLHGKKET